MQIAQQILFVLLTVLAIGLFTVKIKQIARNIKLGHDEDLNDNPGQRWKNMLLLAFGQKKCSGTHWWPYCIFLSMPGSSLLISKY